MDKKTARNFIRTEKRKMTEEEIWKKSERIVEKVCRTSCFLEAESLYCYVSYNQEVMTKPLILKALEAGKKVAVPKIIGRDMEFFYIHSLNDLSIGYQGIEEPVTKDMAEAYKALMILPGLAFDESGNRVGYGGGFYDRYLEKKAALQFKKVAVAFDFQIVEELEMEACDWKVDGIITELRTIGG